MHEQPSHHDRHRFQTQDDRIGGQEDQAVDLGHGWIGTIPHHHSDVL